MAFHLKNTNVLILLMWFNYSTNAQPQSTSSAEVATSWSNNPSSCPSHIFPDGSAFRSISSQSTDGAFFSFGFYCNGNCTSFILSVIVHSPVYATQNATVVWSSNRNNPVRENATLDFTLEGDLILTDVDGTYIWSTNTTGRSILGMNLTGMGNLVLYDTGNQIVWQSYHHPTDTLIRGQKLVEGQQLISSVSEGAYSVFVTFDGLSACIGSDPPMLYYKMPVSRDVIQVSGPATYKEPFYLRLINTSVQFYLADYDDFIEIYDLPPTQFIQYMRLGSDGHLRVYQWAISFEEEMVDLFSYGSDACDFPLVCGHYGICTAGKCSCPGVNDGSGFFRPDSEGQLTLGCSEAIPLSCEFPQYHQFLDLEGVSYFHHVDGIPNIDINGCKQACMNNCSCKASFFKYVGNDTTGYCFLHNEIYSLTAVNKDPDYSFKAFIKVQITPNASDSPNKFPPHADAPPKEISHSIKVFRVILATSSLSITLIIFSYVLLRIKNDVWEKHESYKDLLPGRPTRFTYKELQTATKNFCRKLGEGGSGSVYEGALTDGTKVAVKCLDALGNVRESFLAEVEILGRIHHVNLVKLIGFCAHKSHKLLVYEYMCNGSLDEWIFGKTEATLDWKARKTVIHDIAKGLAYLHEECTGKILHLDIKPQNILLDHKCNAKVSDFGLSKLVGKDESEFNTTMRGTPGYLAPEWLSSTITEKVDVYSFGIVVAEILCGRRNLDFTQTEEDVHLLSLLEKKSENHADDLIDRHCEDMQLHKDEVMEMMKVAVWCLQRDFSKRPSMSVVLKVLDGVSEIETNLDFNILTSLPPSFMTRCNQGEQCFSTPMLASTLSCPR